MKEKLKTQNAITLVALVITIIVLLILAGVSISLVAGENGVLRQAQEAQKTQAYATAEEKVQTQIVYMTDLNIGEVDLVTTWQNIKDLNLEEVDYSSTDTGINAEGTLLNVKLKNDKIIEIPGYKKIPAKTLTTNIDEIFTSEYKNNFCGDGGNVPKNVAKLTYKSGNDSLIITTGVGDTMGMTFLVFVNYYKNESLISSYTLRGPSGYFNDDGSRYFDCHGYTHYSKGWTDGRVIGTCSCTYDAGTSILGLLPEAEFPTFTGEWEIDTTNSNDYGIQYLQNVLVEK